MAYLIHGLVFGLNNGHNIMRQAAIMTLAIWRPYKRITFWIEN
jgi:hypothetical protein